jgi:hypothetical protein
MQQCLEGAAFAPTIRKLFQISQEFIVCHIVTGRLKTSHLCAVGLKSICSLHRNVDAARSGSGRTQQDSLNKLGTVNLRGSAPVLHFRNQDKTNYRQSRAVCLYERTRYLSAPESL